MSGCSVLERKSEMKTARNLNKEVKFPDFPREEHETRINRAKELMRKRGIDAWVLFNEHNIRYFSGFEKVNYTNDDNWRRSVIIPSEGKPVSIVPQILYENFKITTWIEQIQPYGGPKHLDYPPDHHTILLKTVRELGLEKGKIGIELSSTMLPDLSFREFERIKKDLPQTEIVDASEVLWEQRMIKTEYELTLRRDLCDKAIRAFKKAVHELKEGMTEKDFHSEIMKAYIDEGLHSITYGSHSLLSGPGRGDAWIMSFTDTKLKKGDMIFFDGGPIDRHYFTDFQRNILIGPPSKKVKDYYKKVVAGQEAALATVRPGVEASEIYRVSEEIMKKEGVKGLIKFVGHGIGLQNHEPPYLEPGSHYILGEGMVLCVEVGAYEKDIIDCVLWPEDMVIVTDNGCEVLTESLSRDLIIAGT
jgi:Xaa-Pro dipeptidase